MRQIETACLCAGVLRTSHQECLLHNVRILRERGAAWVYLLPTGTLHHRYSIWKEMQKPANVCVDVNVGGRGNSKPKQLKV